MEQSLIENIILGKATFKPTIKY